MILKNLTKIGYLNPYGFITSHNSDGKQIMPHFIPSRPPTPKKFFSSAMEKDQVSYQEHFFKYVSLFNPKFWLHDSKNQEMIYLKSKL